MQRFWALIDDSAGVVSKPRFDLALLASSIAVATTWALRAFFDVELPFLFCVGAVIFASLEGGLWTGTLATIASLSGTILLASSGVALVTTRNVGIVLLFCGGMAVSGELTQRLRRRERQTAARSMRREQTLQTMFDDSPAVMLVVDAGEMIVAANEAAGVLFDLPRASLTGLQLSTLLPRDVRRNAGVGPVVTSKGRMLHLSLLEKPLPIDGQPYRMIYIRNETDVTIAGERLSATQRELYRMARATTLNQFGSSIAHELNQPLAFVANYLGAAREILGHKQPNIETLRGALDDALKQLFRTSAVLKKLKEFVGRRPPMLTWLDVAALLDDVGNLGRMAVKEAQAELQIDHPENPTEILADAVQLQQVLLNLVVNAIDAVCDQPVRQIRIRTWRERSDAMLTVAVEDSGCGLPDFDSENLFAPFRSTKPDGVGIGLAICRGIVEAHGGRIWCDPATDLGGARFLFTIPGRSQEDADDAA